MHKLRPRLTFANVTSCLALFVALGGSAYAAAHLKKNSVGAKQIKSNAVTSAKIKASAVTEAKIKASAVTAAKIKEGSVDGSKIANGSVTGADINAPSTSFSQVVTRLRETASVPFETGKFYGSLSYTQNAGEDNQVLAGMDLNFSAGCVAPRAAQVYLLEDAGNPPVATPADVVGIGAVEDKGSGSATRRVDFGPFAGGTSASKIAPASATGHTFTIYMTTSSCSSGSGVTVTGAGVDVIGTK